MKILFVHIPKCGGISVHRFLSENQEQLGNYTYPTTCINNSDFCHKFLKYEIDNYSNHFKITIIRDPNLRFISIYTYIKKNLALAALSAPPLL